MLEQIKQWVQDLRGGSLGAVRRWAGTVGLTYKQVRDEPDAFVLDGKLDGRPWRAEVGSSKRFYIAGRELRARIELGVHESTQLMVSSRHLLERLEAEAYQRFTEGTQTRIDPDLPEEMRWISMYPELTVTKDREWVNLFAVFGSDPIAAKRWVQGRLEGALYDLVSAFVPPQTPMLMILLGGRVYLRMELASASVPVLERALSCFETAAEQALRLPLPGDPSGTTGPGTLSG